MGLCCPERTNGAILMPINPKDDAPRPPVENRPQNRHETVREPDWINSLSEARATLEMALNAPSYNRSRLLGRSLEDGKGSESALRNMSNYFVISQSSAPRQSGDQDRF
jgi:hypothetical protein